MKEDSQKKKFKLVLFWIFLAILAILSFFILQSFIIPLVSAFVLSYLSYPIYQKIKQSSNEHIAAILTIILLLGIVIIPLGLMIGSLFSQAQNSLSINHIDILTEKINSIEILQSLHIDFEKLKENVLSIIVNAIGKTLSEIPSIILSILITVLGTYYMLLKRQQVSDSVKHFIPFSNRDKLTSEIELTTKNIMYGYFLIAFLEFIVGSIGFYFAGINNYLILPAIMAMLAFIPGIGPGLIWIPTLIIQIISGEYVSAIIILITGLIISVVIETLLLTKIIGNKSSIHPLILLMGILGGVPIFGIFGFIIGPIVLAYTIKILQQTLGKD